MSTAPYQAGFTISSDLNKLYYSDGKGQLVELADLTTALADLPGSLDALRVTYTPAGAGALQTTVKEKLDRLPDVSDFGADPTGLTDSTPAFVLAWAAAVALGKPRLHVPSGTYVLSSVAASFDFVSGFELTGDGAETTTIWWQDTGSVGYLFGRPAGAARISNVTVRGIHFRGNHDADYNQISRYPLLTYNVDGLCYEDLKVTYSRTMGLVARGCFDVRVHNCTLMYCARDGINTADCNYVRITDNTLSFIDDDAIGCHSQIYNVADRGYTISGNVIRFAQGIRCLGAIAVGIVGNTLEFCMAQGISVESIQYTGGALEGITPGAGITIAGNTVRNCIDRAIVDNLNQTAPYIVVGGAAGQAGGLAAIPGENVTGTASVISPYPYFRNVNNADTTLPVPGNYMVTISGNTFVRDLPESGTISSLGYGQFYTRTGPKDCTLTTNAVRQVGALARSGILKGMSIVGNTFMGLGAAFSLSGASTKLVASLVSSNVIFDCTGGLSVSASNTQHHSCLFLGNMIDLDPFMLHANRGANGTFLALGGPTAFLLQGARGFSAEHNTLRNLCRISDYNVLAATNLTGTALSVSRNTVECDPAAFDFSTSNKGIGQIPRGSENFVVRVVDSDPGSATYGQVLNNCPRESSAMPTTGKYITGHFVKNFAPVVAGGAGNQYVITGWLRLTVGNTHVLDTDWREMRCLTGT